MKKAVTPEQKPPIPDVWYLVTTSQTESGFAVAMFDGQQDGWIKQGNYKPILVDKYFPTPLNELD